MIIDILIINDKTIDNMNKKNQPKKHSYKSCETFKSDCYSVMFVF